MHVDQAMTQLETLRSESEALRHNPFQAFLRLLEFPDVARNYLSSLATSAHFCLRVEDIEGISDGRAVDMAKYYFAGITLEKARAAE